MPENKNKEMKFPLLGAIVNVQAYKYNGYLYRQWNGVKVIRNTDDHFALFIYKTRVAETEKSSWVYREPVIWFMPKHENYNALIMLKKKHNYIYVNMASKPIYEDNTIKFIDFDLDIKSYPKRELAIVDRDEFAHNSKKYEYPESLKKIIYQTLELVVDKYEKQQYFFNPKLIDYYIDVIKKDNSLPKDFRAPEPTKSRRSKKD
ncbi:DUF402 domain-containing protein [Mycoplasma sp. ES3157-GEN-MYC]|uniref:DUF402 domain-containing protein n=1 Tax=Mycoplasma miroungigenitalium TaxID=754515 RepID=A0A6M4J930_9MOLU|nr:DUF402 domain-containing protein [Mycoplasma miroungigenitalium]MBU4690337.1 DUF402 domain-containing protein [Mycoplasma miroungigenitalium]MBU4691604.1 DUF402 domain-containing protein [Mycoplasma miroungigenitalium]QJR43430.1 DUF402 domain-containing protein [Mycoplasma miroungigenitalium]